jgi:hypothetical protein
LLVRVQALFTHISVLLVDVSQLEPDIPRSERSRRVVEDVPEALQSVMSNSVVRILKRLTSRDDGYFLWCLYMIPSRK